MKLKITMQGEFEVDPSWYPEYASVEEIISIEQENFRAEPEYFLECIARNNLSVTIEDITNAPEK